ncbi:MAG TPA: hypothetical protein PLE19_19330 [Planctomycetota bacterium]|nr:hypothetical protein [Planctomycetota bacterium]HRR82832.1 hypothetical protein [Planctomycetota bacterium]HRT96732.1 hypothetical protein [Planctomycetota bacterium]
MGSLTEFWIGRVLVFLYEDGFTVFLRDDAEFTAYVGLLEVIAVAAVLLLAAKWARPSSSWLVLLAAGAALGATGMWLGVTSNRLAPTAYVLTLLGIPLGLCAFAVSLAIWRALRLMGVQRAQRPAPPAV